MDFVFILNHFPSLLQGAYRTLWISLVLLILSNLVGISGALAKGSTIRPLRVIATVYAEVSRNTPELVQIYFAFFVLPSFGLKFSAYTCGILAMTFFGGGYFMEVYRSGIEAVAKSQIEAAQSLALNRYQQIRYVILPQAVQICLPSLGTYFIYLLKSTSLLSAIGIAELTFTANDIIAKDFHSFEMLTTIAVLYLIMVWSLSWVIGRFEKKYKYQL